MSNLGQTGSALNSAEVEVKSGPLSACALEFSRKVPGAAAKLGSGMAALVAARGLEKAAEPAWMLLSLLETFWSVRSASA